MLGATSQQSFNAQKSLTFKDWKSLKDDQNKPTEKLENENNGKPHLKPTISNHAIRNKTCYNRNSCGSGYLLPSDNVIFNSRATGFLPSNNCSGMKYNNYKSHDYFNSRVTSFLPTNNCSGMNLNNYKRNGDFGSRVTSFLPSNNCSIMNLNNYKNNGDFNSRITSFLPSNNCSGMNLNNYKNNGDFNSRVTGFFPFNNCSGMNLKNYKSNGDFNSRVTGFLSSNSCSGINLNNYKSHGNYCGPESNYYSKFRAPNNFNSTNNFGGYSMTNSRVTNRFTNSSDNCSHNSSKSDYNHLVQPKNFFNSDCDFLQKDMMQNPLQNPFLYRGKGNHFPQQHGKRIHSKDEKRNENKKNYETKIPSSASNQNDSVDAKNKSKEPEVCITNRKVALGGKKCIPKPTFPDQNSKLTYEEQKQQWKTYRQAMKPFKNRDFYNAKRVVQRLGKKAPSDLNEKELFRLTNAEECMAAHKARLNAKYANYVKAEKNSNELGEIYILKTTPTNESNSFTKPIIK